MTTIRPPTSAPSAVSSLGSPSDVEGVTTTGAVHETAATREAQASAAASTVQPGWVAQLEAGQITREQAVEGLVAQALEAHGAAHLSQVARAELADVLRNALLQDPALSRLLGD